MKEILQFDPLTSAVDVTFWETLAKMKINLIRLDDQEREIHGELESRAMMIAQSAASGTATLNPTPTTAAAGAASARLLPCRILLSAASLGTIPPTSISTSTSTTMSISIGGKLKNTNTLNEFKELDKNAFLKGCAEMIWNSILDGSALKSPHLLNRFGLITFADLKKYKFYYWFAFPALLPSLPSSFKVSNLTDLSSSNLTEGTLTSLLKEYTNFKRKFSDQAGFFLIRFGKGEGEGKEEVSLAPVSEWNTFFKSEEEDGSIKTVGFLDPSSQPNNPGWPLRNYLFLIHHTFYKQKGMSLQVLGLRATLKSSLLFTVSIEASTATGGLMPEFTGWEKGLNNTLSPRVANLGPLMDPKRLADTAVDLNLKLMRWRILPSLNLERIAESKCLLLGAGTLGCYVARLLMAWGVKELTFVDNGKVSFSNPVRQPLFKFEDCLNGGMSKAEAAAKSLKEVYPGMKSVGIDLSIPMPGHFIDSAEVIRNCIKTLKSLIFQHDVIFLLTDSRESRWLPTLLGAAAQKIVINVALGFDSFLVLRHGIRGSEGEVESKASSERLGCYFCNDVVAPLDSLSDRTLDQQCTVTRPGLSGAASAVAVELFSSLLNHPQGGRAPADLLPSATSGGGGGGNEWSSPLGMVPHQVRGSLSNFSNLILKGSSYDKCTACSDVILKAYRQDTEEGGEEAFLLRAIETPSYLEEVTGLTEMKRKMDGNEGDHDDVLDWDEEEEEEQQL